MTGSRKQLARAPAARPTSGRQAALRRASRVLHGPAEPLREPIRSRMEAHFGAGLGHVRVHAGPRAARSARELGAVAYAVGRHVVLGEQGRLSNAGRTRLMAHELAHVVQQGDAGAPARLSVAPGGGALEAEADRAAAAVGRPEGARGLSSAPRLAIQRWKIDGNTATLDSESDTLGILAEKITGSGLYWTCIRPTSMRTSANTPLPADFEAHYERYGQIGDKYDLSALKSVGTGSLRVTLFPDGSSQQILLNAPRFYPGIKAVKDPDVSIQATSGEGSTPLAELVVAGHQAGAHMWGDAGRFEPDKLDPDLPAPTFSRASAGKFPRRGWMSRFSASRSVGCNSTSFGEVFAAKYLSKKAHIYTTLRSIAPGCTPKNRLPSAGGGTYCASIDALEMRPRAGEAPTPDHGPFENADDFHGSSLWSVVHGKL